MITIRQATIEDIPLIMKFIDEHWRKGDALAIDRRFFEWSFLRNGIVTMIIGIDDQSHTIYGINGYMPYTDDELPDCAGTIWKAIRCEEDPLLGIHIGNYKAQNIPMRYNNGAGIRNAAIRMVKLKNGIVDALDHYYRINTTYNEDDFRIAHIDNKMMPEVTDDNVKLKRVRDFDEFKKIIPEKMLKERVFRKDYSYIYHRYYEHPIYKYDLWKLDEASCSILGVLITREIEYNNHKACKIVDYYGVIQDLRYMGKAIDEFIKSKDYEFVDVYSYGIPTEYYENAGFIRCNSESKNIIPNYFEPYESRNVDIYVERPQYPGLILFRGDGDQDRPCRIQ